MSPHNQEIHDNSLSQSLMLAVCSAIGIFAGLSASLFSLLLSQVIFHVTGENSPALISRVGGHVMASFLSGWMIGGIAIGMMSDRWGRVRGIALSIAIYSVASCLVPFATTVWQLHLIRFVSGIGIGGAMVSCAVFLSESRLKMPKTLSLGVLVGSYQGGVLLSGVIVGVFSQWQQTFAWTLFPLMLAGIVMKWFPEPDVYKKDLLQRNSEGEAGMDCHRKYLVLGSLAFGSLLVGYWASLSWIPTWMEGLLGSHQGKEKAIATMLHGFMAIVGCLTAGMLCDRWGRRRLMIVAFMGAFLCSWKMFFSHLEFNRMIYIENGLLGFFIGMAQAVLYIYLPELFPKEIRGTSVAFCLNAGRGVTIVALFFVSTLVASLGGFAGALSCFALFYLLGAGVAWLAPETK